jgi:hypothetical protein
MSLTFKIAGILAIWPIPDKEFFGYLRLLPSSSVSERTVSLDSHSLWGISLGGLGRRLLSSSGQFEKNYPIGFIGGGRMVRAWSKTGSSSFLAELPRFENSRNVEMTSDYFFSPNRRRSSLEEIAPSFFVRDRERSMIARNLRFVLRDTVSSSAFRIGTTAAKGFPPFTTIIGSFLAF